MTPRVMLTIAGYPSLPTPSWPEDWPVPRVGDEVTVYDEILFVRHVDWRPTPSEPYVYVVLGDRRVQWSTLD